MKLSVKRQREIRKSLPMEKDIMNWKTTRQ
jgi:hypothetical protein